MQESGENVFRLRAETAILDANQIDLMKCIDIFESGKNVIWLVDEENRYTGHAVFSKDFSHVWTEKADWVSEIPAIENSHPEEIRKELLKIVKKIPNITIIPVVSNGQIVGELFNCKDTEPASIIPWEKCRAVPGILKKAKIFFSSLESSNIFSFFVHHGLSLNACPLTNENLSEALDATSDSILIYETDIFPNCKKISVRELNQLFVQEEIRSIVNSCIIDRDWAQVPLSPNMRLDAVIPKFDEGYQSVNLVDAEGKFNSIVCLSNFREDFPRHDFRRWDNLFLDYASDSEENKSNFANIGYGFSREEIPFLQEGRIVANGCKSGGITGFGKKDLKKRQPFYWQLISDEVLDSFFRNYSRILVSSNHGVGLAGFCASFSSRLNITVFHDELLPLYIYGEFDLLVYDADVWLPSQTPKCSVGQLYADLLAQECRLYLERNGIHYLYIDVHSPVNDLAQRIDGITKSVVRLPQPAWSGVREDYILPVDEQTSDCQVIAGRRRTVDSPRKYQKSVFVYGPCAALGVGVDDSHTMESYLQKIINLNQCDCRVVNCGSFGLKDILFNDMNNLYIMADTCMHKGDIVVHLGQSLWTSSTSFPLEALFNNHDIFDNPEVRHVKHLCDSYPAHLNAQGYEIMARFIYGKIKDILDEKNLVDKGKRVPPVFSKLHGDIPVANPDLQKYISELSEEKAIGYREAGAIVMNANPFTLGHLHLIQVAQTMCEFLYVFVVEEDKSHFSFTDRMQIVKDNCKDFPNVKVLPSGRYMISKLTFQEYFNKEELQNTEILPTMDVKLFGEVIAPVLNITRRFVGEEPFDTVTKQYNDTMKELLPNYGVELIEIPRKMHNGKAINATEVRRLLSQGMLDECRNYLPLATIEYIKRRTEID